MTRIVFYISGHGHGHARRCAELIKALVVPGDVAVHVRTTAPAALFSSSPQTFVTVPPQSPDSGAIESDILTIDEAATWQEVRRLLGERANVIAAEAQYVRAREPDVVLADVPYLAAEIASQAGIPCFGFSNFTWDWIYEDFAVTSPDRPEILAQIRESYGKMDLFLRLPFGPRFEVCPDQLDVPLVAQRSLREREEILSRAGLPKKDRPWVVFGMRSGVSGETLALAAARAPDVLFFSRGATEQTLPRNVQVLNGAAPVGFLDLLKVCDVAVSKLGYGIVSDCIAAGTRLLYPPRTGFREDEYTAAGAREHIAAEAIPAADFRSGNWAPYLERLLREPACRKPAPGSGAGAIAELILQRVGRSLPVD